MKQLNLLRAVLSVLLTAAFNCAYADNLIQVAEPTPALSSLATVSIPQGQYVSLCFHDIRDDVKPAVDNDPYAVNSKRLAEFFDWMRTHDWHPVSLQQIIDAENGKTDLPKNAVLLSFDDGLRSIYTKVFPLLKTYHYPALFALETGWLSRVNQSLTVDYQPERFNPSTTSPAVAPEQSSTSNTVVYNEQTLGQADFITWSQAQEMHASGLIEFASHTHNLHLGILANPQGNLEPAAITRAYLPAQKRYETDQEFHSRILSDLQASKSLIAQKTGVTPRAIVWPYGAATPEVEGIAREAGFSVSFGLQDRRLNNQSKGLMSLGRLLITSDPDAVAIETQVAQAVITPKEAERAIQIDMDYLYDPTSEEQTNINLGKLLDRIKAMHIRTVYLQAFADPSGAGNVSELYFPNRALPMRADLFNRVAWQLSTRAGVRVFAWLPMLSFQLPDHAQQQRLSVKIKNDQGQLVAARSDYQRLSPFLPESAQLIGNIYADLAKSAPHIAGVLIHDDAYLAEGEDQTTSETGAHWPGTNRTITSSNLTPRQKTEALIAFGDVLINRMKPYTNVSNPFSVARNLYARVVLDPAAESRFAQALDPFIAHYDYVALMAMPYLDGTSQPPEQWLNQLAEVVKKSPDATNKVVFELQTRNWQNNEWISGETIKSWMQSLVRQGIVNLAYYPDDFIGNHPEFNPTYEGFSLSEFPHYGGNR